MKRPLVIASLLLLLVLVTEAQTVAPAQSTPPTYRSPDAVENISNDTARMARAVEALSRSWGEFTKTFSTNQGLQLDDKQKRLILALEVLNRLEASLSNMQKLRFDLTERQTNATSRIAQLTDDLLPENIDRWVSMRGTTNAETLRNERRQSLTRQLREWQNLLIQVTRELESTLVEARRTELQVRGLRDRVFAEAERQLADF